MKLQNKYYFLIGTILICADQAAKFLVYSRGLGGFLLRLQPVFSRMIFPNYNFAFSLPVPHFLIYIIYVLLLALLLIWFSRVENKSDKLKFGVTLILAGALSNIFDRIYLGYVRDFIYVFWGGIFNLADLFILAGILFLLV